MNKKQLIIMRGLPGSGKSTHAKKLKGETGVIHSTDDFQIVDGEYQFDEEHIEEFHTKNFISAQESMKKGISPVIIDNTNIFFFHFENYVIAGINNGYEITIVESEKLPIEELMKRNVHNVPRYVVESMCEAFESNESVQEKINSLMEYLT